MDDLLQRPTDPTTLIDGLELRWDGRVMAPRPWTRLQARWAAELHPLLPAGPLLELCCGVGHIGLLTVRGTGRPGVLVDADAVACEFARRNAWGADLAASTRVVRHRVDGRPIPGVPTDVPLVLADPPYLPSSEVAQDEDPDRSVDGGDDGLELVELVLRTAAAHLSVDGACLLQVRGARQAHSVAGRLSTEWSDIGLVGTDVRSIDERRAIQCLRRRHGSELIAGTECG